METRSVKNTARLLFFCMALTQGGCAVFTRRAAPEPGAAAAVAVEKPSYAAKLRVAALQYPITGALDWSAFEAKFRQQAMKGAQTGAELLVFPELLTLDALKPGEPEKAAVERIARELTPRWIELARALALELKVSIMAGTSPRFVGGVMRNTALTVLSDGRVFFQDKLFLTKWEADMGITPGQTIEVVPAPWGPTAVLICYDIEFPYVSQSLAAAAPEVILVPSQTESPWGMRRVLWSAQARAIEHHAFVVVSPAVGHPQPQWRLYGQAAVITPQEKGYWARPLTGLRHKESFVMDQLNLETLRRIRAESKFYPVRDQRGRGPIGVRTAVAR